MKESRSKFIVCEQDGLDLCKEVSNKVDEWKVNVITVNRSGEENVASLQQFLEQDNGTGMCTMCVDDVALPITEII